MKHNKKGFNRDVIKPRDEKSSRAIEWQSIRNPNEHSDRVQACEMHETKWIDGREEYRPKD